MRGALNGRTSTFWSHPLRSTCNRFDIQMARELPSCLVRLYLDRLQGSTTTQQSVVLKQRSPIKGKRLDAERGHVARQISNYAPRLNATMNTQLGPGPFRVRASHAHRTDLNQIVTPFAISISCPGMYLTHLCVLTCFMPAESWTCRSEVQPSAKCIANAKYQPVMTIVCFCYRI